MQEVEVNKRTIPVSKEQTYFLGKIASACASFKCKLKFYKWQYHHLVVFF